MEQADVFQTKPQKILDIGSGEGANLLDLGATFPEAELYAIEPSPESQKHLQEMGVHVIGDDVDASWDEAFQGAFDLIVMRHVLEHFLDPKEALIKLGRCLSEDGVMYIAVPNNLNPIHALRTKWFRTVHTYYFNRYSLYNILALTGFEVQAMIEMDVYNKAEIVAVATKATQKQEAIIDNKHYDIQKKLFSDTLRREDNLLLRNIDMFKKKLVRVGKKLAR